MNHRHLDYPPGTPVASLGPAAIDDLLDRGDLADWAPLAAAVASDPSGPLARTITRLCDAHPMYGTSALWRAWIERARARTEGADGRALPAVRLADLRRVQGLTQSQLAQRLGMAQSDLSKLERRTSVRLSSLRAYVTALGGRLALVASLPGHRPLEIDLDSPVAGQDRSAAAGEGGDELPVTRVGEEQAGVVGAEPTDLVDLVVGGEGT